MDYKRHLPPDNGVHSLHVAINRIWDALEAAGTGGTSTTVRVLGSSGSTSTVGGGGATFTVHNTLSGLQGGDVDNYWHLTSSEYIGTGTGVFARSNSPVFTGSPVAPTATLADNSTLIATTAFVQGQGFLKGVVTDATLTGDGTVDDPLSVVVSVPAAVIYLPVTLTVVTGTLLGGTVASANHYNDGDAVLVQEVVGVPGFDVRFSYTDVAKFNRIQMNLSYYNGNHHVYCEMWNYVHLRWDSMWEVVHTEALALYTIDVPDCTEFIDVDGNALVRFYHTTSGNNNDELEIDYCILKDDVAGAQGPAGPGVPSGGVAGQVLQKVDGTDYNTEWATPGTVYVTLGETFATNEPYRIVSGRAYHVTSLDEDPAFVDGVTLESGVNGETRPAATISQTPYPTPLELPTGTLYFLGQDGKLTSTVPTYEAGDIWRVIIARKVDANTFIFSPTQPLKL